MSLVITCKNEDDSIKNKGARVDTTFSQLYIGFVDAEGQLTPQSAVGYGRKSSSSKFFYACLLLLQASKRSDQN